MSKLFIETLSEESVLYVINKKELKKFQQIALHFAPEVTFSIPSSLAQLNIFVTVCNVWFTLHAFKRPYFLDETRRMHYAAAYLQLEFIEQHPDVKRFLQYKNPTDQQLFFLAFCIGIESMLWTMNIMQHAEQQTVITHYMQEENFLKIDYDFDSENFKQTLEFQKIYIKEMKRNLHETTDFHDAIKYALRQAQTFLSPQ